ncbi:MAG: hypothetical protein QOK48_583 [Blastocatellia bacterium]|jgi:hypothetical protein|nr:hypothetical protein [Blastocatellia bacterium]
MGCESTLKVNMAERCWICSNPADSSEHRFKKTDLVSLHGHGPYTNERELLLLKGTVVHKIKGPSAQVVKYEKSLCRHCNNAFTQPFDYAYEKFIAWVFQNKNQVIERRIINFEHIYGQRMEDDQRNLYKYFAKSFGCRLANDGFKVPSDVSLLMKQERFQTGLRISLSINEDMLRLADDMQLGLAKGPLFGSQFDSELPSFIWQENYKWLNIFCWYNWWPKGELGFPWVADSAFLYLGTYALLDPIWHSELVHRIGEFDKLWVTKMAENNLPD